MSTEKSTIRVKRVSPDKPATAGRTAAPARDAVAAPAAAPEHAVRHEAPPQVATPAQHRPRETKPFFLTSEFLLTAATIAGLLVAGYLHDDTLNAWRTWLLVAVVASAYIVSRGIAKAGSSDRR